MLKLLLILFFLVSTCYSTVGFGDVNPPGNWRILGAIEAVTGILMFGWSTGVLFAVVNHLQARFRAPVDQQSTPSSPPRP
jgi:hypothetical protein